MDKNILGTNVVTQVAILVNDIEKTGHNYADFLGVEYPGFTVTAGYDVAQTEYLGEKSNATSKLMFFNINENLCLELIEPDNNPSVWRNDLNKNGEGFHHIAFVVNGMTEVIKKLDTNNMKMLQKGEYNGGRYSYVDAKDNLKVMLELLEND